LSFEFPHPLPSKVGADRCIRSFGQGPALLRFSGRGERNTEVPVSQLRSRILMTVLGSWR
jgi:hypothetical protein